MLNFQEKHVAEVVETSAKFSNNTEEKIIQEMERSVKNREEELQSIIDKIGEYVSGYVTNLRFIYIYNWRIKIYTL